MKLLLATRSQDKVAEIAKILAVVPDLELVSLMDEKIEPLAEEEGIERYSTFEGNAEAKARYFAERSGLPVVADDSGLVVDALDGKPGVHSKRFAPGSGEISGEERDRANNEHLLSLLGDLELSGRTARYVCVAAFIREGDETRTFRGEAEGLILGRPRGHGGFGYDPLFYDQKLGKTFAESSRFEKNDRSHRGKAFRALAEHLRSGAAAKGTGPRGPNR